MSLLPTQAAALNLPGSLLNKEASGWVGNAPSCQEPPLRAEKSLSHHPVAPPSPFCSPPHQESKVPGLDSSNQRMPFLEESI